MKTIGNILWFLFGGFVLGILWCLLGALLCITIIGIPFGVQCFKFAKLSFFPYGKKIKINPGEHPIANIIWALVCGWEMSVAYFFAGLLCCITVVGIPNGIVAFKMMKLAFLPFGAKVTKK